MWLNKRTFFKSLFLLGAGLCRLDCATHGCSSVLVFVYLSVNSCMCAWSVQPMCDTCMHTCVYLGLLYELVLLVCECGRGRPSACQYVLMLHIWFPNFPPSLPSPRLPSTVMSGHCFVFSGWRWGDGGDVWWVMAQNTGHQHSPSLHLSPLRLCAASLYFLHPLSIKHYWVE